MYELSIEYKDKKIPRRYGTFGFAASATPPHHAAKNRRKSTSFIVFEKPNKILCTGVFFQTAVLVSQLPYKSLNFQLHSRDCILNTKLLVMAPWYALVWEKSGHAKKPNGKDAYDFAGDLVPPGAWKWKFRALYIFCAVLAAIYGICAFQYGLFNLLGSHGPFQGTSMALATNWSRWNDHVFAPLIDQGVDYFEGKGSTTKAQSERYGRNWYFMSPHQMSGGVMILCSIVLMNPRLRYGRYAKWHRMAGDTYVVAHVFSLYGSLGFLIKHTFHQGLAPKTYPENIEASISHGGIYGGSVFTLTLWLYWTAGALSLSLGVWHILRGEVQRHRSWMSINYGTTMGAAFLRLNWAAFAYLFPQYRMDEINNAAVIPFIVTMLWVAAGHSSLAHRKVYSLRGFASPLLTAALGGFGLGSACMVASQSVDRHGRLFDRSNAAHVAASVAHVASWCTGLVTGGLLLPRIFHDPSSARSALGYAYILSAVGIFVTTSVLFRPPFSLGWVLAAEMGEGHFYALFARTLWEVMAISVLLKTLLFALAVRAEDEARIVEWALHSYGGIAVYSMALGVTWATGSLFPTPQDAVAHASLFATLAAPLVAYIASIYVMKPEPEEISARRNGMFWDFRRRSGTKAD